MAKEISLIEIYRNRWLLAVHKPVGLLVHRSSIDKHETEFALQYARLLNGGEHVYPVHRLDRPPVCCCLPATCKPTVGSANR